ncbi:hypothetical protein [Methanoculleus sp.]|jgi:hypothetical protein|uniref:hypothetical protein n=1 Tax=Methanoculleus sp. TaxID=90427 RepID=UPI0025E17C70|nr:hypothetical protein [Methanoculleus sp.]MCK9319812.1 hypothetical protein [Methanoculleus sp.]
MKNIDTFKSYHISRKIKEGIKKKKNLTFEETKTTNWKGDKVGKIGIHIWVKKWKGAPNICEQCGKVIENPSDIHWHNIDHKYRRVLDDYIRLCRKCHGEKNKQLHKQRLENYKKLLNK